ncbi:hypothetical protein LTR28_009180 [Elasticomyces elasticus]|nr:hypothetical protein LTR28_009180 [Elasticomyces elasticus]
MAARKALVLFSLEIADMILASLLWFDPASGVYKDDATYPPIIIDIRPGVHIAIGREEDVSGAHKLRSKDGKIYYRRVKIRSL